MFALSSIQPTQRPASGHPKRLLAGLLLAAALLSSGRVRAEPCNPDALCPSSPCVVTGSHVYEQGCFFDWTGKDVTIAGGASLYAPNPGGDLDFLARNLTIDGAVEAKQANSLFWEIEQNFTTRRTSGPGRVIFGSAKYYGLDSTINVGGSATFGGSAFILNGQYVRLNVSASSVAVNGLIQVISLESDTSAVLGLNASTGSITITQPVVLNATGPFVGANVLMFAPAGDISVDGPLTATARAVASYGSALVSEGLVQLEAGGKITTSKKVTAPLGIELNAGTDLVVGGALTAKGNGQFLRVGLSSGGSMQLAKNITASGRGTLYAPVEAQIQVQSSDALAITGNLASSARGPSSTASIDVSGRTVHVSKRVTTASGSAGSSSRLAYACSADLTGAKFLTKATGAGASASNRLVCPCTGADNDGVCDSGCSNVVGLGPATASPPFATSPNPQSCT